MIVAGGLGLEVEMTDPEIEISMLRSDHEEADTKVPLKDHCVHASSQHIVVSARDTDITIILLAHFDSMHCEKLWLKAGTSKKPKYIPIHEIRNTLSFEQPVLDALLAFHAITGCDTVSYLMGHSKKTSWDVFLEHNKLLQKIGEDSTVSEDGIRMAEAFICRIYKVPYDKCDKGRVHLFSKCKPPESLPPTTDAPGLIRNAGFKAETHVVTTTDGYNLKLHRIPNPGKKVVFLQHGLLSSSADWVLNNANESLGFILAKNQYDVWFGNFRGNTYSRSNIHYSPDDKQFWMFSWDEMASIDLPTMIDYVLKNTSSKSLYYVGHSMGTTTAFALFSSKPEYQKKIEMFFALAPVATVAHMKSPIRYLANILPEIETMMDVFGLYDFLPQSIFIEFFNNIVCKDLSQEALCADSIFLLCGFDKAQLNETRLPIYFAHTPAGTSTKTVIHYAQLYQSKGFTKYDFGTETNIIKYGQKTPPSYHLQNMTVPTILYYGQNDWLADPKDVSFLQSNIKRALVKKHKSRLQKMGSLRFHLGN
ncbi:Gastric triacylglycerol lipase [Nymphon striatum]|nr:Gastric triacylglycerol lipase [Nymphon striatum]